jgi:hypothetical protein
MFVSWRDLSRCRRERGLSFGEQDGLASQGCDGADPRNFFDGWRQILI